MASEGVLTIQEPASIPLPHSRQTSTASTKPHTSTGPVSRHPSTRPSTPHLTALPTSRRTSTRSTYSQDSRSSALPLSTDSMVTIRLSKPLSISTSDEYVGASSIESISTIAGVEENVRRRSSLDIMHGVDLDTEINGSSDIAYDDEIVQEDSPQEEVIFQGRPASDASLSLAQNSLSQEFDESRRSSLASSHASADSDPPVDWQELDKEEQSEEKEHSSDESTAFLLARLEQENNALAIDPRFNAIKTSTRMQSRPPSMQVLKKMVRNPSQASARFSLLPNPPPMTELEFWAALVKDYPQTAHRLPTLTSNKIKGGVPPPLRGVVWMSMVGAREVTLSEQFDQLASETSPYEVMIGKDIGRSFPGVEMFKEVGGEGQTALMKVLKCFSLYDKEIGYCQGLGFLVGPLLMQMPDKDAFCVLVKLMENYDLRSCYMPDLAGLHLRIFQFQRLLTTHLPELAAHLASLQVEAAYLSQWFLSFFAVTCPLPMLFRIYDVILAEGASETIMRVSLSLMRRNQEKLMQHTEFEEVMQLLLGRALWEPYNCNADDLVNDFMEMTGVVTPESLQKLDQEFKDAKHAADPVARAAFSFPDVSAAATRFMGRLWAANAPKPNTLSPAAVTGDPGSRPGSFLRRTPSKQSIATINSSTDVGSEGTGSVSTVTTDATMLTSRDSSAELSVGNHSKSGSVMVGSHGALSKEDRGLHGQIEELLMAISDMQREQSLMSTQLQKEREDRDEDHRLFRELVDQVQAEGSVTSKSDRRQTLHSPDDVAPSTAELSEELASIVDRVEDRLATHKDLRRSSMMETKQRLRDSLIRHKDQLVLETSRTVALNRQLDEQEKESATLREQLREARERLRDGMTERERMQRTMADMRRQSVAWPEVGSPEIRQSSTMDSIRLSMSSNSSNSMSPTPHGLRELTLGRTSFSQANKSSVPPRGASLATQKILSTKDHAPATEDALVVELAHAKTAEAAARTELEEVKGKMDALRKMLGMPSPPAALLIPSHRPSASDVTVVPADMLTPKKQTSRNDKNTPPTSAGAVGAGWWWSRRTPSTAGAATPTAIAEHVESS